MAGKEIDKKAMSLSLVRRQLESGLGLIYSRFEEIEQFKDFTLEAIKREQGKLEEHFRERAKNMSEAEASIEAEFMAEDYSLVTDVFTKMSLESFVIVLYSYIENGLNMYCEAARSYRNKQHQFEEKEPFELRYTHMKGKSIDRAKLYLKKVIGIDLKTGERPWGEITALRKIRNVIVHDRGWANEDLIKQQYVKECVKDGLLEIEKRGDGSLGKVIIKPGYLSHITKHAREFFRNIKLKY